MPKFPRVLIAALTASIAASALAGCAPSIQAVDVVTTTNVWADITKTIAGNELTVRAVLTNPSQDPHSYEASPRDQLLISKAKLIIAACNDSDSFIKQLVKTETNLLCLDTSADSTQNPHIWYSPLATFGAVQDIRTELAHVKPASEKVFTDNFQTFTSGLDQLREFLLTPPPAFADQIKNPSFTSVEPVADYLMLSMGLTDLTPASVKQAGMNETDLSPDQLVALKVATAKAGLYAYNSSQPSLQSDQIQKWLKSDPNLPEALGFSEQLPEGVHYLDWMWANAKSVYGALTRSTLD